MLIGTRLALRLIVQPKTICKSWSNLHGVKQNSCIVLPLYHSFKSLRTCAPAAAGHPSCYHGSRSFLSTTAAQVPSDGCKVEPKLKAQFAMHPNVKPLSVSFGAFTLTDALGSHASRALETRAVIVANCLCEIFDVSQLNGMRVALLCRNDVSYVVALWAIWLADGVAVPLNAAYSADALTYFIEDSQSKLLLHTADPQIDALAQAQNIPTLKLEGKDYNTNIMRSTTKILYDKLYDERSFNIDTKLKHNLYESASAVIIYTSGTTGKPKVPRAFCASLFLS